MAFRYAWTYHTDEAWESPVPLDSWLESDSESSISEVDSAAGRTVTRVFSRLKPAYHRSLGLMISVGDAARRVVDTHLAHTHISFLAAFNISDV